jgi:hypothetical protein
MPSNNVTLTISPDSLLGPISVGRSLRLSIVPGVVGPHTFELPLCNRCTLSHGHRPYQGQPVVREAVQAWLGRWQTRSQ